MKIKKKLKKYGKGGSIKDDIININGDYYNNDIIDGLDRDARVLNNQENKFLNRYGVTDRNSFYNKFPTEEIFNFKNGSDKARHYGLSTPYVDETTITLKNGGSIKKYPNGGRQPKYEWSKGIDNIQPITQTQNNSSITTGNKKLSTEELKKAAEYTKKYNQQHLEEEYNNRQNKLKQSIDAQKQPLSLKNLQTQTQSTGDKLSLAMNSKYGNPKDYPTLSGYIQGLDYINPFKMIGDMASGLGSAPQDVNEGNYLKAGLSVGTPLFAGATAGIGTQGIKPFVNNLVNPLAGTGEVINNLGNKYLPNAYKLNPYAFKPNSEMMYRGIGKEGMEDALESGVFRAKQNVAPIMDETGRFDMSKQFQGTYYSPKFNTADQYGAGYIAEVPKDVTNFRLRYKGKGNKTWSQIADENIPIDKGKILKKDWLQGYKPIEIPKSNFKSEIDWSKWNKEIPENTQLMKEYNAIEQQTKANNTWMKNPDGSEFQGTPEQFVQQNSENFKKAFPEGSDRVYRGGNNENFSNDRGHPIVFTADKETARNYVGSVSPFTGDYELASPDAIGGRVLFDMYHPKNNSNLIINNQGKSWREISRNHFGENSPVRDLHNTKGDFTSTDDIAKWMVANDKNSVRLNNIFDSYDAKFVDIVNHKQGNYLKSATSNNGMFDMTNPNIYKALVPGVIGLGAASQIDKKEFGGNITKESEWELVNETNKKLPKRRLNLNKSSDWEIVD